MPNPSLLDLLLPSRCAICDAQGPNLCLPCKDQLIPRPQQFVRGIASGIAATSYTSEIAKLLIAFKELGQFALAGELVSLLGPLTEQICQLSIPVGLVPAPSRSQNFAKRGYQPSLLLAKVLSRQAANASVLNCLRFSHLVKDQVGLSGPERIGNLAGAIEVNQDVSQKLLFVVDDVVTTGATIQESWRALSLAGATVLGALVVSQSGAQDANS